MDVSNGGTLSVGNGGSVNIAYVSNGGIETIGAGGSDGGTIVQGGEQDVGGVAIGTEVNDGVQIVEAGGTASFTAIGETEIVEAGGVDVGATVGGGEQDVYGSALGTIVNGGSQIDGRMEPFGREGEWTRWSNVRNTLTLAGRFLSTSSRCGCRWSRRSRRRSRMRPGSRRREWR